MKFFTFDPPTPRHSRFRMRGVSRDLVLEQDWGRSINNSAVSFDVRIMYRDGTKAPLGDFPDIEEGGLVVSQSALDVFRHDIDVFFEIVPINITGAGVIKENGVWHVVELKDVPDIPDRQNPYFYLHPAQSLQREYTDPRECPRYQSADLSDVKINQDELDAKIESAKNEYLGSLGELEADIGSYDVGSVFVAGNLSGGFKNHVGIYFTDDFIKTCRRHKLSTMRLYELANEAIS